MSTYHFIVLVLHCDFKGFVKNLLAKLATAPQQLYCLVICNVRCEKLDILCKFAGVTETEWMGLIKGFLGIRFSYLLLVCQAERFDFFSEALAKRFATETERDVPCWGIRDRFPGVNLQFRK